MVFSSTAGEGRPARFLRVEPHFEETKVMNEVTCGPASSGDQAYIFAAPYDETDFVRGTIPAGHEEYKIKGSLQDPAHFAASQLYQKLEKAGITIKGDAQSMIRAGDWREQRKMRHTLLTLQSPTLSEIVKVTNQKSVNLFAEHLLKMIGFKVKES